MEQIKIKDILMWHIMVAIWLIAAMLTPLMGFILQWMESMVGQRSKVTTSMVDPQYLIMQLLWANLALPDPFTIACEMSEEFRDHLVNLLLWHLVDIIVEWIVMDVCEEVVVSSPY